MQVPVIITAIPCLTEGSKHCGNKKAEAVVWRQREGWPAKCPHQSSSVGRPLGAPLLLQMHSNRQSTFKGLRKVQQENPSFGSETEWTQNGERSWSYRPAGHRVQKQVYTSHRAPAAHGAEDLGRPETSEPDSRFKDKDEAAAERKLENTAASLCLELVYARLRA